MTTSESAWTPEVITELHAGGLPLGSYSVLYYSALTGRRSAAGDSGCTAAYVENAARRTTVGEVMVATCDSQPGGMTAYGSEEARAAWRRHAELERQAEFLEAEKPWAAEGAFLRVVRHDAGRVMVTIDGQGKVYRLDEITPAPGLPAAVLCVWTEIRRRASILLTLTEGK